MKRIFTLLTIALLITLTESASAQDKADAGIRKVLDTTFSKKDPQFSSTTVAFDKKTQVLTLTGNASFKTDKLQLADAGKIVYDEKTKKLVAYECKGFSFDGEVVIKDKGSKVITVEYIVGENILYVL